MPTLTAEHFERSIAAAKAAQFDHYAGTLQSLYAREFPEQAAAFAASAALTPIQAMPVFRNVTGAAYGVANAAARARGNPVNDQIREHRQRVLPTNPHP